MNIKSKVIIFILFLIVADYNKELINCGKLPTFEKRNVCRQQVTEKYRYVEQDRIEVNVFTLPRMQKNVVDFKEVFKDEDF